MKAEGLGLARVSPQLLQPCPLLLADDHVAPGAERDRRQHRQRDRQLHLPLRVPPGNLVSSAPRGKKDTKKSDFVGKSAPPAAASAHGARWDARFQHPAPGEV